MIGSDVLHSPPCFARDAPEYLDSLALIFSAKRIGKGEQGEIFKERSSFALSRITIIIITIITTTAFKIPSNIIRTTFQNNQFIKMKFTALSLLGLSLVVPGYVSKRKKTIRATFISSQ